MKRLFAIFMSVYILSLFAVPCSDVREDLCVDHHEQSANTPISHQSGCDCCSPFCTCNCCTSPVPVKINHIQVHRFTYLTQEYIIRNSDLITPTVQNNIWQPPQAC